MKEITDCPFCGAGSPAVYLSGSEPRYYVCCDKCRCFGPTATTKERAIHYWNRSNDHAAILSALVNCIENRPVLESFLKERGTKATWKCAQELCH